MTIKARAFSLLEILVTCGLFSVLATLALSIIVPMLQASQRGTDLSDLRQSAAMTLEIIAEDVEQSAAAGLKQQANCNSHVPLCLSVQQIIGVNADGTTIWSPHATVYFWDKATQQLRVATLPSTVTGLSVQPSQSGPIRWPSTDFNLICTNAPSRHLCGDVQSFGLTGLTDRGLEPPLVLTVTLQRKTGQTTQTFNLEQSVTPRVHNTH